MKLSKYAHPVTRKVWMTIKYKSAINRIPTSGSAEVFENGFVVYFDSEGTRTYSQQYKTQIDAVNKLLSEGYSVDRKDTSSFSKGYWMEDETIPSFLK